MEAVRQNVLESKLLSFGRKSTKNCECYLTISKMSGPFDSPASPLSSQCVTWH